MRGRRASFATTDRTWWSLKTLQEQTIMALLLPSESDESRDGQDQHKGAAPSRDKPDKFLAGHVGAAGVRRGRWRSGHHCDKRLSG
jgi:hypothetical protein